MNSTVVFFLSLLFPEVQRQHTTGVSEFATNRPIIFVSKTPVSILSANVKSLAATIQRRSGEVLLSDRLPNPLFA
jgi:hypothetical protein